LPPESLDRAPGTLCPPGPDRPLYFAGALLLEMFQIGAVQGNVTLSVGALRP
jgi:hypothetical protein